MVYLLVLALIRLVECTNRTIHSKSGVRSAGSPIVVSDIVHASRCHSSYARRTVASDMRACTSYFVPCRTREDTESWWMSGCRDVMFYYRIYKGGRGQHDVRLGKVPGDMLPDCLCRAAPPPFCLCLSSKRLCCRSWVWAPISSDFVAMSSTTAF